MKKKLTLKKEAIIQLETSLMNQYKGGTGFATIQTCDFGYITCLTIICPTQDAPEGCNTQAGGGGARAAGSCGSCGQQTCNGQHSCVPYDCAPTNGENSCNFPNGCALPSVGCAQ